VIVARISGATRNLGAPKGWDKDRDGVCGGLPIRDEMNGSMPCMTSAWQPTPDELALLNAGASVHLRVVGMVHPPVMLSVGAAPE
jgi:hypothetical protein